MPRDELADLLWEDELPATWEKALRVLMTKLRALLEECGIDGSTALTSAFGCYKLSLPSGSWIDVDAAVDALERAEAELAVGDVIEAKTQAATAAALARRIFLPGEDAPWVEEKRRDLHEILVRAVECMRDATFGAGDFAEAVRHAEEAVGLEPFRESGYRRLMESHAAAGNPAEALRVYERCRRFLADELGAYPSAGTEAVYLDVLRDETATDEPADPGLAGSQQPEPRLRRGRTAVLIAVGVLLATGIALAAGALSGGGEASAAKFQTLRSDRCSSLHYRGAGSPEVLIVADLPLWTGVLDLTSPMVDAMALALERHSYRAGTHRVALQVCNESSLTDTSHDSTSCTSNAREYVANPSVIGVVGPFTSFCAMQEIPVLNRAPDGPVAIVSGSNTYTGLTRQSLDPLPGEPGIYYPTGQRNYARVIPTDDAEAAADAIVVHKLGVERVAVLHLGDSLPIVSDFARAARRLGMTVAGHWGWPEGRDSYARLAARVARAGADGVFITGGFAPGAVQLLRDLRAGLGRGVQFVASGFDTDTAVLNGSSAEGLLISQPGPIGDRVGAAGKRFAASYSKKFGEEPTRFALSAAQAMDVLLDAIARSDGTRASVTRRLFDTRISNGILGSFWITPTGDTTLNDVTIQRVVGGKVTPYATIHVPDGLVAAE